MIKELSVRITLFERDGKKYVLLSDNGLTGDQYEYKNKNDLMYIITHYTNHIIDYTVDDEGNAIPYLTSEKK